MKTDKLVLPCQLKGNASMNRQIGVQLYSARNELAKDFKGTLEKIAAMGYDGVELAGLPAGVSSADAVKLLKSLNLSVVSGHMALPVGENKDKVIAEAKVLGVRRIVHSTGRDVCASRESIKNACATINEAAVNAKAAGLQIALHNHWWEFQNVDGELAHKIMLKELLPDVVFEIDTYWVKVGGVTEPATVIKELGARVPLVHIKDGPGVQGKPMTAVGQGCMDFPTILASVTHAEWLIVELDECATDMLDAIRDSITYLKQKRAGTNASPMAPWKQAPHR